MSTVELWATVIFAVAIAHTFSVKRFNHLAHKFPNGSVGENLFHLLGEVEVVFAFWAIIMLIGLTALEGFHHTVGYLESQFTVEGGTEPITVNFTEPLFVFVIMAMAATRPILALAEKAMTAVAKIIPAPSQGARFYIAALVMGPLLGSFITEPAAMTVTALLLKQRFYDQHIMSKKLMYATIGLLFVNVSIGGTLTNFAAPPVLMVAHKFDWDMMHMLTQFGWKAAMAVLVNTVVVTALFRKELAQITFAADTSGRKPVPAWLIGVHVALMALVVALSHHMAGFGIVFLLFLGVADVTGEHQDELKLKEALLVGGFLMGLVLLGGLQRWWLEPTIGGLGDLPLFFGATGLTAVTDNAALTYLGSQVPNLSAATQYALVAGAVTGGGLTVIANAPNPAGYGILKDSFGDEGISPIGLLIGAIGPTIVAIGAFLLLPNL